ncbi:hypothetical protein DMB92_05225 [Campylobacter sp. MIT 99-7217]|uniref:hypothetical protein n=1 Tax=Campylobacter sp. MIT 99-7217 TaxID=535091 RepID=UPI00115BD821|nr:hypothetical protein [Campylobacter sp. MIT 99-7217]TQR31791.1 hypothetical protein DMB92_05225 [Campylobacter sp. MIT 99-7217]
MAIQDITAGRGALANVTQATANLQNANTARMQGFTNGILQMSAVLQNQANYQNAEEMRALQKDQMKAKTDNLIASTDFTRKATIGQEYKNEYQKKVNDNFETDFRSMLALRAAQTSNLNANAESIRHQTYKSYVDDYVTRHQAYPNIKDPITPSITQWDKNTGYYQDRSGMRIFWKKEDEK